MGTCCSRHSPDPTHHLGKYLLFEINFQIGNLYHFMLLNINFLVLHHGFKIQDTIDVLNKGSSEVRYVADLNRQHGTASIKRHGVDIIRTPTSTRIN